MRTTSRIVIASIFVSVLTIFCGGCGGEPQKDRGIPIEKYRQNAINELRAEVAQWPRTRPDVIPAVEKMHGGVLTVDAVDVKSFSINTFDNSDVVKSDESNIESITFTLRFWWDGLIHKDGHTDIAIHLARGATELEVRKTWVEETDAIIPNIDALLGFDAALLGCLLLL